MFFITTFQEFGSKINLPFPSIFLLFLYLVVFNALSYNVTKVTYDRT